MPDSRSGPPIVALVASAGGLDALTRVLEPLPEHFPASVIVLQHIDPERRSALAELLARHCRMPVHAAEDHKRLEPGIVVVAPPGRHVLHTMDGTLALIVSGAFPPHRPSADLLLTSLAVTAGPRVVAVVLSGLGMDGATGATAVHDFGGVVVTADEASSREYAMPKATLGRDDAADVELAVDDIADHLVELVSAMGDPAVGERPSS